jgi:hypothetical protein
MRGLDQRRRHWVDISSISPQKVTRDCPVPLRKSLTSNTIFWRTMTRETDASLHSLHVYPPLARKNQISNTTTVSMEVSSTKTLCPVRDWGCSLALWNELIPIFRPFETRLKEIGSALVHLSFELSGGLATSISRSERHLCSISQQHCISTKCGSWDPFVSADQSHEMDLLSSQLFRVNCTSGLSSIHGRAGISDWRIAAPLEPLPKPC